MKFAQIRDKYLAGTLEHADLDGIEAADVLKVREEAGEGRVWYSIDDLASVLFADGEEDGDDERSKSGGDGPVPYVMVSDQLIPPFMDRVESTAWDTREFKYRGSVLLYGHNMESDRPPIGRMTNVRRDQFVKRGAREFKALTGDADFVSGDVYPFAGMIGDLVRGGHLRGGSVGFTVAKARAAKKEEQEELGMREYSSVIQRATLEEFSVVPLGRDANAQRLGAEALEPIEAALAEFLEAGVYDDRVIGEFREDMRSRIGEATRFSMTVAKPEPEAPTFTIGIDTTSAASVTEDGNAFTLGYPPADTGGTVQPITYYSRDTAAHSAIESLSKRVADLEERLAEREQADSDVYGLIFSATDHGPESDSESAPHAPETAHGEGPDQVLEDLAEELVADLNPTEG